MINRNLNIQSFLLGKKTIIIYKEAAESIFVPTIWLIIFVVLLLIIFILCRARYPEDDSDADYPFELSRVQPNYCNTNGSTETRGDSRRDHQLPRIESHAVNLEEVQCNEEQSTLKNEEIMILIKRQFHNNINLFYNHFACCETLEKPKKLI